MKKYLKIIFILALGISFQRCDNAIDIDQPGRLTDDVAFQTLDDLQTGIIGVYTNYDLTPEIAFAAQYTDEIAEGFAGGGQGRNDAFLYNLTSASDAPFAIWTNGYAELNAVNRLIAASQFIEIDGTSEQAQFNNILGQAYALRAFSHFQLLSYFTTDYTDDSVLGVIKLDFVPTIDQQLLRNTNGEIYDLIEEDLNKANSLLTVEANPIFVSKDFVKALKTRIAAYRGDYSTAATLAQELLMKYPLANRSDYTDMFLDQNDGEVIFKFKRVLNGPYDGAGNTGSALAGGWAGANFAFVNATVGGGAYFEFGRSLFNLFSPDDVRYSVSVAPTSVVDPNYETSTDYLNDDKLIIQKYPGSDGQFLKNDLKVFRSSEMLLILAESYANSMNLNGASNSVASAIKQLRDARFGATQPLPNYSSAQEAWEAILNERRVEFAFEGHRWKDIKRLGSKANQNAERHPKDCSTFNMICELPYNDHRFTMPIPLVEFNGNPGLREQQNPGYN